MLVPRSSFVAGSCLSIFGHLHSVIILQGANALLISISNAFFVRAIIYLPYEVKAFGKNSDLRYDIFKPIWR